MKKAKHNIFIYNFFKLYILFKIKRCFSSVVFPEVSVSDKKSVLVIANHVGWWDGFWVMYLNMKKFHKKFYFMMLEKQLKNHWFFGYTGGYPVKKRSHEIIDCLNYTSDLLYDSNNMVLMFPQGNLESIYQHEFVFEKGVERVIRKSKEFTEIIFVANLIDFYKKPKPSLFINYIVYGNGETDIKSIQEAYNKFYNNTLNKHKKMNRG